MANVYATKTGNWTDNTVWNTGAQPTSADDVYANNFTVTINTSPTVLSVRTTSATGIAAGGLFQVSSSGLTLTCTGTGVVSGGSQCLLVNPVSGSTFSLVGNVVSQATGGVSVLSTNNSGVTINITGNVIAGTVANANGINLSANSTINITGTITGGTVTGGNNGYGISNIGPGTVNVTGNVYGGTVGPTNNAGIINSSSGTVVVNGSAFASAATFAINNSSTGVVRVTNAVGNGFGLGSVSVNNAVAVSSGVNGSLTYVKQLTFGSLGQTPVSGPIILTGDTTNTVQFYKEGGGTKTLVDTAATSGVLPAATDVRTGVVYSSGNLTGSCAVPAAGSVALGVAVDNTTGTAVLTAANVRTAVGMASANLDTQLSGISSTVSALPSATSIASAVWAAATRTLTTAIDNSATIAAAVWGYATGRTITGGTVDTLTNAPSVPSAATIASQVRTELSTELARIDVATSTRLAPSGTLARVTLTDTTTTLTNAPNVPSAATIASQVRTELATELGRIDVATSTRLAPSGTLARVTLTDTTTALTNSPDVPTEAEIAAQVRTELTPELARVANCATVATTGQQIQDAVTT